MSRTPAPPRVHPTRGRGDACPGAVRLYEADDGWLARVRVPGGRLSVEQGRALGALSEELGDGHLELTARGNLQMRALAPDAGAELAARLHAVGLLPSVAHDRARNIVASPLSGLDGHGHVDVSSWVREVDERLCARRELTRLSGRFLIALDDGRGDVASLGADVTVVATPAGTVRLRLSDVDTALTVPAAHAARLAAGAAAAFLAVRGQLGSDAWRVAELPGAAQLIVERLSREPALLLSKADWVNEHIAPTTPALGVVHSPGGCVSLSVLSKLGRLTDQQWRAVTAVSAEAVGELRITPWRGVVIPHVPPAAVVEALGALLDAGFVAEETSPFAGVTACTGRPGCARSLADVRRDAMTALASVPPGHRELPVHLSGCGRRCGHPMGAHIEVVADEAGYRGGPSDGDTAPVAVEHLADFLSSERRAP